MYEITIESFGYHIKLRSDVNIKANFLSGLVFKNFIPGFKIVSNRKTVDLLIIHKQSNKSSYLKKGNNIYISDDWSANIPIYVVHLLYKFFNSFYLSVGIISVHSSAIEKSGVLFLLIGFSGSGKTSLLIKLLEEFDFKMVSGNKILLEITDREVGVVGATNVISVRNESPTKFGRIRPINSEEFCGRNVYSIPRKWYSSKVKFKKICIVSVKVNNGVREFFKMDNGGMMSILYPISLDLVNRETIMFDGNLLVSDNIPLNTKKIIFSTTKKCIDKSLFFHASGSLNYICKKINKIC